MSSPVILSRPPAAPDVPANPWGAMSVLWEGWDGSVWDLNNRDGGVVLLSSVEGLHAPRITRHTSSSLAIPGNRLRGWHAEARDVFWPIYLFGDSSEGWQRRNSAFFKTIHPDRAGTWRVRAGGHTRTLRLTGVFDDAHSYKFDPFVVGWARHGITLEAAQPYWEGEKVTAGPWKAPEIGDFFGAGGPPFFISSSNSFAKAVIINPGDLESWGVWTAVGPLNDVELGVGGAVITVPFDVPAGQVLVIDTDPRNPTATMNGVDMTTALGLQEYAPVPDGDEVELHVGASGSGEIQYDLIPLYFRAF